MRKLDLTNFTFTIKDPKGINQFITYQVKGALANVLTHPSVGLNGPELLEVDVIVQKIEKAGLEVILTNDDYKKITELFKRFRGFSKNDIKFVKRIYNCPETPDDGKKVLDFSEN